MVKEIANNVRDGPEGSAWELFLGEYGDVTEFLEGVDREPDRFEECYQSDVITTRIRALGEVYAKIESGISELTKKEDAETLKRESLCENLYAERAAILSRAPEQRPPRFWLQVILNSDTATHFAGPRDDRILKYVTDIESKTDPEGTLTVTMSLGENPYIKTDKLIRSYNTDGTTEGTYIEWKDDAEGNSMQYKTVKRGRLGKALTSIIWGFDNEKGALNEEEIELLHTNLATEIVPNAFYLYVKTPDALEDDGEEDEEEDEFDEEDEEDEDEDEDEDKGDEDRIRKVVAGKSKGKKKHLADEENSNNANLLMGLLLMILLSQCLSFFS